MCVVGAKYFPKTGWVLVKNRDQDYVSDIKFEDIPDTKVGEVFVLYDKDTGYQEGMNYNGLTIITASLAPAATDETDRSDGKKIHNALKMTDPEKAAKYVIDNKLTGFIFIANKNKLVLVEAALDDHGKGTYHAKSRVIPYSEVVVRTNHGIELPWAGFQYGYDEAEDLRRKSSELRKKQGEQALKNAKNSVDMVQRMSEKMNSNLQMNVFRIESKPRQMRTIFQWALVPSESCVYIKPVQCKMNLTFTKEMINIEVLNNDDLKKRYPSIKHLAKIKMTDNNSHVRFTSESIISFREFIS